MRVLPKNHARGFTLVEAVLCSAIVAAVLVPALQLVVARSASQITQAEEAQALALAKQLMTEILQCHYVDPDGSDAGETRATFDDVLDYKLLSDSPPQSHSGAEIPGYTGWRVKVHVGHADRSDPDDNGDSDTGLVHIKITVTSPNKVDYVLAGLRSSSDGYDAKPNVTTTYTSWVDITLESGTGSGQTKAVSGVNLLNQVP